jgi:hypothetical protein
MPRPSYSEIASSFDLWQEHIFDIWQEYADPDATTSKEKFDAMSHADRMALLAETFGPEPVPTVDDVLARTASGDGYHRWPVPGGIIQIKTAKLRPLLKKSYHPAKPDWTAMVDARRHIQAGSRSRQHSPSPLATMSFLFNFMAAFFIATSAFATFNPSPDMERLVRNLTLSGIGFLFAYVGCINSDDT